VIAFYFFLMAGDLVALAGVLAGLVVLLRRRNRLAGRAVALGAAGLGALVVASLLNVTLRLVHDHGLSARDVAMAGLHLREGIAGPDIFVLLGVYCCWAIGIVLLAAGLVTARPPAR
jgi:hypothetical protein